MSVTTLITVVFLAVVLSWFVWYILLPFLFGPAWLSWLLHRDRWK